MTLALLTVSLMSFAETIESTPCVDYGKIAGTHPGHYVDAKIHLIPSYSEDGKRFVGYVIVRLPKGSPFVARGFQVGDVLTEIDGAPFTPPSSGVDTTNDFAKIKANAFKSAKLERCQKISLTY